MKGPVPVRKHYLYRRWAFMRQVCYNTNSAEYPKYGGRGISIDPAFEEFWDFVDIVESKLGPAPDGFRSKLARKDQDGDYTIKNLKWDDAKVVGRRCKRSFKLTYRKQTKPLRQWSEETGINFFTLMGRIERGWTPAQILGHKPGPKETLLSKKNK